jgi:hypothetical protein
MLPIAHASVGFLISQIKIKGKTLSIKEVVFIMFCANFLDLDLFYVYLGGQKIYHHLLPSHTPAFAVGTILVFYFSCKLWGRIRGIRESRVGIVESRIFTLAFLAMLSHLALDDLSYWLKLLGVAEIGKPEIFWAYPFDLRRAQALLEYSGIRPSVIGFLADYIKHPVFIFEWVFLLLAMAVFIKNYGFLIRRLFFQKNSVANASNLAKTV